MRISLRKLAVFDAVARHASVSLGAKEVALSQSAASMALKELEEDLGIELFHRSGRKLSLNENGRRLQPLAQSILAQAREVERMSAGEKLSGILRITAVHDLHGAALGALCSGFVLENPGVRIRLEMMMWGDVLDAVESMSCDLGFVPAPSNRPQLTFEPLIQDDLVIFASANHPLAANTMVTINQLAEQRWCIKTLGHLARGVITSILGPRMPGLDIALESNDSDVLRSAVQSGLGIGCLPRSVLQRELAEGIVAPLNVPEFNTERLIGIITPAKVYRGALQDAFCLFARSSGLDAAELVAPDNTPSGLIANSHTQYQ